MTRYVYEHDGEAGLGEAQAGNEGVPLEHRDAGDGPASSMAELDMPHGTVVELDTDDDPDSATPGEVHRDDDHDLEIVTWTDQFGVPRRTSVEPGFFAEHFTEVED